MRYVGIKGHRQCEWCGDTFAFVQRHDAQKGRFCTLYCSGMFKTARSFSIPCAICNITIFTQPAQLKYRHRKTCSRSCNAKYLRWHAEHRRLIFGYTKHQLDRLARSSPEAEAWRKAIFERDDYTCTECGARNGKGHGDIRLEADHIQPWAYFPELRFELSNGRTLCRPCHDKTKMDWREMRKLYAVEG